MPFESWHTYVVCFKPADKLPWCQIKLGRKKRAMKLAQPLVKSGTVNEAKVRIMLEDNPGKFIAAWRNVKGECLRDWGPVLATHGNLELYKKWFGTTPTKKDYEY